MTLTTFVLLCATTSPAQVPHPTSLGFATVAVNGLPPGPPRFVPPGIGVPPGTVPVWWGGGYGWWYEPNPTVVTPRKQDVFQSESATLARAIVPDRQQRLELTPAPEPGKARITLEVPADAVVTVEGQPTKQTGEVRVFNTPKLDGTANYVFEVKWGQGESATSRTVRVPVAAGATPIVRIVR